MIHTDIHTQTQMNLQNPCRHKNIYPGWQVTNICKLYIVKIGFGHFFSLLSHSAAWGKRYIILSLVVGYTSKKNWGNFLPLGWTTNLESQVGENFKPQILKGANLLATLCVILWNKKSQNLDIGYQGANNFRLNRLWAKKYFVQPCLWWCLRPSLYFLIHFSKKLPQGLFMYGLL